VLWLVLGVRVLGLGLGLPPGYAIGSPSNRIRPIVSLEMPVPSQGHYGFHSFPVVD
jgi:hypothetical protein